MNFLALEYFLEIERAGSFSAAARKLFVSQQSLSESIQKLEQEVGPPWASGSATSSPLPSPHSRRPPSCRNCWQASPLSTRNTRSQW